MLYSRIERIRKTVFEQTRLPITFCYNQILPSCLSLIFVDNSFVNLSIWSLWNDRCFGLEAILKTGHKSSRLLVRPVCEVLSATIACTQPKHRVFSHLHFLLVFIVNYSRQLSPRGNNIDTFDAFNLRTQIRIFNFVFSSKQTQTWSQLLSLLSPLLYWQLPYNLQSSVTTFMQVRQLFLHVCFAYRFSLEALIEERLRDGRNLRFDVSLFILRRFDWLVVFLGWNLLCLFPS